MGKRVKPEMLAFAKRVGAWRGGRPDWYTVAERLAEISKPELLTESVMATRGPGRPKNDDEDFLATEVHRVMWAFNIGVREACRRIDRGDKVPLPTRPGKPARWTAGSPWKGTNHGTLESRYWRWRRAESERQKKLTVEIP